MDRVGIAVIGYGYWGPNLVRNFQRHPRTQVRWVCDLIAGRREAASATWPGIQTSDALEQAFEDPEVQLVAVATPLSTHYELAKAALEANKHVLVEKPMTTDLAQAEALVSLAAERGLQLFVDHTYLFTPEVRYIKKLLDDGGLGDLLYLDTVRINLGLFQQDHDVVWDLAPHDLSILIYLLGRLPRSVLVTGATHNALTRLADVAMIHMDFGDDLVANVHVNWLSPVKIRKTILAGRKKMLVFDDLNQGQKIHIYDSGVEVISDPETKRRMLFDYRRGDMYAPFIPAREALGLEVDEIVSCLDGSGTPTSPGSMGVEVVRLLCALSESLEKRGERVSLE